MSKVKPLIITGVFWFMIFIFVIAGFSGNFGTGVTGFAVREGSMTDAGLQGFLIITLFFTNLVTMFFLVRQMAKE